MSDVDVSELLELAGDMRDPSRAFAAARATTIRAAKNIERDARSTAPRGPHIPSYASSITTDVTETASSVTTETGPLQRGQGAFGQFLEFGSANNPPHPHLMPAAEAEIPVWLGYLGDAAAEVI